MTRGTSWRKNFDSDAKSFLTNYWRVTDRQMDRQNYDSRLFVHLLSTVCLLVYLCLKIKS